MWADREAELEVFRQRERRRPSSSKAQGLLGQEPEAALVEAAALEVVAAGPGPGVEVRPGLEAVVEAAAVVEASAILSTCVPPKV